MKSAFPMLCSLAVAAAAVGTLPAYAQDAPPAPPAIVAPVAPVAPAPAVKLPPQPADIAAPKLGKDGMIDHRFQQMHESFLARGKSGKIGLLFLGDSITEGWNKAKDVWTERYAKYDVANFGIGGDQTQHVLWRMDNGELDGISPKVVVLMIGTNNSYRPAADILRADTRIVEEIHQKLPDTKVLLLGIFPRGNPDLKGTPALRKKIETVNEGLAKLDDGNKTRYLDFGAKFLDANGNVPKDIMPDYLHPNHAGYVIWADAMQPLLDEMMK